MIHEHLEIISRETIAKDTVEMTFKGKMAQENILPGQFLHLLVGEGSNHMLRRPISIAGVDKQESTITIIFKLLGEGTNSLSKAEPGDQLDALGPCGQGYPVDELQMEHALLVGGGIGVPPLYYLAQRLYEKGIQVTMVAGFQNKEQVFYEEAFRSLGDYYLATDDGSAGEKGFVTDIINKEAFHFDQFFTCGPTGMLKAVSTQLANEEGFISIEQRMGCGIGACFACVVPAPDSESGYKKICKDGPVFRSKEVVLA
ncbi:dihydroorotate dehydrogenase electron transfer subunit [Terribacillus saccharophilus]|uniref:dihydroorotate dehydrogenase electron transfer subunit n=1 Tax=Terribacillus saccharophilus TaxID=361277 RepID=UPI00211BE6AD|nr:dihydroorotate dehydrogenase electron transfer subunit [Terribacillus saccharophilus]